MSFSLLPILAASSCSSYLQLLKFQIPKIDFLFFSCRAIFRAVSKFNSFWIKFPKKNPKISFKNLKIYFCWKLLKISEFQKKLVRDWKSDQARSSTSHQNRRISIHVQTWVNFMEKYTNYWEIHPWTKFIEVIWESLDCYTVFSDNDVTNTKCLGDDGDLSRACHHFHSNCIEFNFSST